MPGIQYRPETQTGKGFGLHQKKLADKENKTKGILPHRIIKIVFGIFFGGILTN